ncbi:MAG: hypothetical protein H8E47_10765 [Anaerolineales bacterium]|nr:hypothetical protein [Anaerolineales bacterium]
MKIHVEIYVAAHMLQREQGTFSAIELVDRVRQEFGDTRPGVQVHATSHCVANKPLYTGYINNYLWQLEHGRYRCFDPARDTPHPDRVGGRIHPPLPDVPPKYRWLLQPEVTPAETFQPVPTFSWDINRAERSLQVSLLAPLLERPEGRLWFLQRLGCPCSVEEAQAAQVFHLCFPLRDLFTADYYRCRGKPYLEDQFIAYYNRLFGLPEDFGVDEVWRTAPGGEIRHPAAGGRAGWYDDFLRERISDENLCGRARNVRRILHTEADVFLLTAHHVILVECKYQGGLSSEQYQRQLMMGETLARRLGKVFDFGLVVEEARDPRFAQIDVPYARWSEIRAKLEEM